MREINIRPMIVELFHAPEDELTVHLKVVMVDEKPGKAREVVALLTDQPLGVHVLKLDTLTRVDGEWRSLTDGFAVSGSPAVDTSTTHPLGSLRSECLSEVGTTTRSTIT